MRFQYVISYVNNILSVVKNMRFYNKTTTITGEK